MGTIKHSLQLCQELPFLQFADNDATATAAQALLTCSDMDSVERDEALRRLLNNKAWEEYEKWKGEKRKEEMDVFLRLLSPSMKTLVQQTVDRGDLQTAETLISTTTQAAVTAFASWKTRKETTAKSGTSVMSTEELSTSLSQSYVSRRGRQSHTSNRNSRGRGLRSAPVATVRPLVKPNPSSRKCSVSSSASCSSVEPSPDGGFLWDFKFPSDFSGLLFGKDGQTLKAIQAKFSVSIHASIRGKFCMVSVKSPSNNIAVLNACLDIWGRMSISHYSRQLIPGFHSQKPADWSKEKLVAFMCDTMTYMNITHERHKVIVEVSGWTSKSVWNARDAIVRSTDLREAPFGLWNMTIPVNRGGLVVGKEGKTKAQIENQFQIKMDIPARGSHCLIHVTEAKNRDLVINAYLDIWWRMSYSQTFTETLEGELADIVRSWSKRDRMAFICSSRTFVDVTNAKDTKLSAWSSTDLHHAKFKIRDHPMTVEKKVEKPRALEKPVTKPIAKPKPIVSSAKGDRTPPSDPEETNILLLGESGIGKSTFINGFYNQMMYETFTDVRKKGVDVCIRTSFSHLDDASESQKITVEASKDPDGRANELLENGKSATKAPRSYAFSMKGPKSTRIVRLIDTPGVLDTNGPEQDLLNMNKTFAYLSNFKHLNAICILMRPDEDRLNHYVRYCIGEILTRLHCDASRNLIFCFTRSSGTNFRPAGTLDTLKKLVEEIKEEKGVEIKLDHDSMFCFDNVAFRTLCALKIGAKVSEDQMKLAETSWKESRDHTLRLLSVVQKMAPHDVRETLYINKARLSVLSLSRPLADVTKNQILNQESIKEKMNELEGLLKEGKVLRDRLVCDQESIRAIPLKKPQLVCADPMCVEYVTVGEHTELHYKTVCHDNCVSEENVNGDVAVQQCSMFVRNGVDHCEKCDHSWKLHTHIRYKLRKSTKQMDTKLQMDLENNESLVTTTEEFIASLKEKHTQMNSELNFLSTCCAQFALFISANSMMSYNDSYKQFIEKAINEETYKIACDLGSNAVLERLKSFKKSYDLQVKTICRSREEGEKDITRGKIKNLIRQLKNNPLYGPFLCKAQNIPQETTTPDTTLPERVFSIPKDLNAMI